jgi:hypothetical protein
MQRAALCAWLQLAQQRAAQQQRWRAAVRHAYRAGLRKGLEAWRSAVAVGRAKRALLERARQYAEAGLQQRAMEVRGLW